MGGTHTDTNNITLPSPGASGLWVDAPRGRQGRHPLNPKPGAKLQEPLGEGTSRVTTSQPRLPFPLVPFASHWRCLYSSGHHFPWIAKGIKKPHRLLFLTPGSPHPQSTVPLHGRCFYATKVLLSFRPRCFYSHPFFLLAAILLQAPLPASNWDPMLKLGVPGARRVARPHLGACGRGGHSVLSWTPPPHSTALNPASRSLQLALCTPTFLEEGNRDGSRQQRSTKGVVGPERCPAGSQDPPSTCSRSRIAEKQRHGAPMAGRAGAEQTRSSGAVRQGRVRPGWSLAELPKSSRPHRCSPLH